MNTLRKLGTALAAGLVLCSGQTIAQVRTAPAPRDDRGEILKLLEQIRAGIDEGAVGDEQRERLLDLIEMAQRSVRRQDQPRVATRPPGAPTQPALPEAPEPPHPGAAARAVPPVPAAPPVPDVSAVPDVPPGVAGPRSPRAPRPAGAPAVEARPGEALRAERQEARRRAERNREAARAEAERLHELGLAEAERAREQALARAERAREEALAEAERARESARASADRARAEAEAMRVQARDLSDMHSMLTKQRDALRARAPEAPDAKALETELRAIAEQQARVESAIAELHRSRDAAGQPYVRERWLRDVGDAVRALTSPLEPGARVRTRANPVPAPEMGEVEAMVEDLRQEMREMRSLLQDLRKQIQTKERDR